MATDQEPQPEDQHPPVLDYARPADAPLEPLSKQDQGSATGRFVLVLFVSCILLSVLVRMFPDSPVAGFLVWGGALAFALFDLHSRQRNR